MPLLPTSNLAAATSPQNGARKFINRLKFHNNYQPKHGLTDDELQTGTYNIITHLIHAGAFTIIMRSHRST